MTYNQNPNESWMALVLLLKEIAESKGLLQQHIAEAAEMKESAVSRFFSLKFKPTIETFLRIAKAVKVNFFFEDQESQTDLNQAFERAMESLGRRAKKTI